jgi:PAS domain S-box-containing protein
MEIKLSDNELGSHIPDTIDRASYLNALFENSLDAILMANDEQRFVEANPAACSLLGYTRKELIRFRVGDLTPPSNLQFLPELWRQFMSVGMLSGEYSLVCKNGSLVTTEFRAVANIVSGLHMAILHDITERKCADQIRSQLAAIVDSSDDAILSKSLDGIILTWNKGAERLYGYSTEEIVGQSISMLIPPEKPNELQEIVEHLKKGDVLQRYETKRIKKNGDRIDVSITLSPVRDASGHIVGGSSIGQDITKRKLAESEQERLYKQVQAGERQLRRLAGYLQSTQENERAHLAREVHDQLGQALTSLKMDLVWLTKRIPSEQPALKEKAANMATLIDETVFAVRRIATELRPGLLDHLGLVAAIEWQVQEFARRTNIRYGLELEEIKPALEDGLATQLFRIVQEALTNIARHAQATQLKIRLTAAAQTIVLVIEDNGLGIQQSQISESKSLGLLGMRERALALGGEFHIRGKAGKGTRLEIRTPRQAGGSH